MAYFLIKLRAKDILCGDYTAKRLLKAKPLSVLLTFTIRQYLYTLWSLESQVFVGNLVSAKRLKTACFGLGICYLVTNTFVELLCLDRSWPGFYKIDIDRRRE